MQRLTESPVLALPKRGQNLNMFTDPSLQGIGCVLMQQGRVIAYTSRWLKAHEKTTQLMT